MRPDLAENGSDSLAWYANEEVLYPSGFGYRGGEMVMDFLRDCVTHGLSDAAERNGLKPPRIRQLEDEAEKEAA